ncbi:MAG TPA: putative glycoside hydrolase, partial [Polyangia bacterium]|nr:putative glycoside hydrolase [Polyangia bacterium]
TRLYYLANYLLVRGDKTYIDYFAGGPLEWYPEWGIDLGAPVKTGATVADLAVGGAYEREFAKGWAAVNPGASSVTLTFPAGARLATPQGGGAIDAAGDEPGTIAYTAVTSVTLPAHAAAIVLK